METFSALLAICARNSLVPGEFPAQRPVTRSFDVFFDLSLNQWLSKQSRGWWFETLPCPLWRHCNANGNSTEQQWTVYHKQDRDFYLPKFEEIVRLKFLKSWTISNFRTIFLYIDMNFLCLWYTCSQNVLLQNSGSKNPAGTILCMRPANESRCYDVTPSLIGCASAWINTLARQPITLGHAKKCALGLHFDRFCMVLSGFTHIIHEHFTSTGAII